MASTSVFVIDGPITCADIPELCRRARMQLEGSAADVVICDVGGVTGPDAVTIDALARLALTAQRLGCEVQLRHVSEDLGDLLALVGLCDVLKVYGVTVRAEEADRTGGTASRCPGRS